MRRAVLCLLLMCSIAYANGRSPLTNGIALRPGDDQSIYLATTFGLLISHDNGCTFRWVCEQNIGYGGQWDPKYAIATDGTIFATTFEGLRISRDGGCSFTTAASTQGVWIDALDIGPDGTVWMGTATTGATNDVFASTDNGMTFQSKGMLSPEIWWKSVKVAPSDASRVYITGYQVADSPTAYFYRSDGAGGWTPSPLTDVMYAATPVLLVKAIDPANPDIVYMSSIGANPPSGDRLYRSADGGMTWTDVLDTTSTIHDVIIKDQHVLVATQVQTTQALMGGPSFESTNGGTSFTPLASAPQLACLAQRPDGTLLGCGANWEPDYKAVARSIDNGATWEKVWRFVEIAGAVSCPAGTVEHDTCDTTLWDCPTCMTDLKRQFGAKGPSCGVQPDETVPVKKPDGCCSASGGPAATMWSLTVLAMLLRRRRRRC